MKEKIIGTSVLSAAVGIVLGALLAGTIGVLGGAVLALVVAGVLSCVLLPRVLGAEETTVPQTTQTLPQPAGEPVPHTSVNAHSAAQDTDFVGIAEEMAFASQQLLWGIDQYRVVIAQVEELAKGISAESETNASSVEEASAGVEEIAASASKVSDVARSSLTECKNSTSIAESYQGVISEVSENIERVTAAVQQRVDQMEKLNEASAKIAGFVDKIRGIAAQTNLLALNASIEAARAGEHGRGFAVVAGEVGKLANESDATTQEIEAIVGEITQMTSSVTEGMRAGSEQLTGVTEQAKKSAASIKTLTESMEHIEGIVDELTKMSESQRETSDQMARAVESVGQATVSIAGSTQEATTSIANQNKNLDEIADYAKAIQRVAGEVQRVAVQFKQPDELIFAVNPFAAPETIRKTYVPILNDVARRVGKKPRTIIVEDYDALGAALASGFADVGWFSPFAYVSASAKSRLQPLVTPEVNHQTTYTGYIVTKKGSGLSTIDDLAGKKFGFVDEKSASGYVYPKAALVEAGKDPRTFFGSTVFLGSHNNVITAVEDGTVDGGATYSTAFAATHAEDRLDIIFRTSPIPTDVIAAGAGVDQRLVSALRTEFEKTRDTSATAAYKDAMALAHINGFKAVTDADYDVVRKAAAVK